MSAVNTWGVAPNVWSSETGVLSITMDDFVMSSSGQVGESVNGSLFGLFDDFTMDASGSATNDVIGLLNVNLDDLLMSADGTLDNPAIGSMSITMDDLTLTTPSFGGGNRFISSISANQITSISINAIPIKAISK